MMHAAMQQFCRRWRTPLVIAALAAAALAVGLLVGVAAGKGHRRRAATSAEDGAGLLPLPGSAAAAQLLSQPTTAGWVSALYQHGKDSAGITGQQTAAFLQLLQIDSGVHSGIVGSLLSSSGSSGSDSGTRLQPFIQSAQDVLSYLRWHHSVALLCWLRDFSSSSLQGFPAAAADPVLLQAEMQQLLRPASLQQWHTEAASTPHSVQQEQQAPPSRRLQSQHRLLLAGADADLTSQLLSRMLGAPGAAAPPPAARPRTQQQQQQQQGSAAMTAAMTAAVAAEAMAPPIIEEEELFADNGEWDSATTPASQRPAAAQPSSGGLKAFAFALPDEEEEEDFVEPPPRVQQVQAPRSATKHAAPQAATAAHRAKQGWRSSETAAAGSSQRPRREAPPPAATSDWAAAGSEATKALCDIQRFAPPGAAAAQRLSCPLAAPASLLAAARPITIPLRFLCLTFPSPTPVSSQPGSEQPSSVPLPPSWHSEAAAANLVAQANRIFLHTGVQFKLQGVAHSPLQHPFLQLASLDAWQACTVNTAAPAAGLACLRSIAQLSAAATTASSAAGGSAQPAPMALPVIVSGSREERAYCDGGALACNQLGRGHSSSVVQGSGPDVAAAADSWLWLSWDMFNPDTANSERFSNRGAAVLARQLATLLGAPEPRPDCSVPAQQLPGLAAWCASFRAGGAQAASLQQLASATSCPATPALFSVLAPGVPDACGMSLSPEAAAAMQLQLALQGPRMALQPRAA